MPIDKEFEAFVFIDILAPDADSASRMLDERLEGMTDEVLTYEVASILELFI